MTQSRACRMALALALGLLADTRRPAAQTSGVDPFGWSALVDPQAAVAATHFAAVAADGQVRLFLPGRGADGAVQELRLAGPGPIAPAEGARLATDTSACWVVPGHAVATGADLLHMLVLTDMGLEHWRGLRGGDAGEWEWDLTGSFDPPGGCAAIVGTGAWHGRVTIAYLTPERALRIAVDAGDASGPGAWQHLIAGPRGISGLAREVRFAVAAGAWWVAGIRDGQLLLWRGQPRVRLDAPRPVRAVDWSVVDRIPLPGPCLRLELAPAPGALLISARQATGAWQFGLRGAGGWEGWTPLPGLKAACVQLLAGHWPGTPPSPYLVALGWDPAGEASPEIAIAQGFSRDADSDGLADALEAILGTSPEHADTDADGLLDLWEASGADVDLDGIVDVDLPAQGADPLRRDLFVEVDRAREGADAAAGAPAWRLGPDGVVAAQEAFLAGDPARPDPAGEPGIALHVDLGQWGGAAEVRLPGDAAETDLARFAGEWFTPARRGIYHWVLNRSEGPARGAGGGDMGEFGGADGLMLARVLGQNLGLARGGGDAIGCKPNYRSVMAPESQVRTFSLGRYQAVALDETALDERLGLGVAERAETAHLTLPPYEFDVLADGAVDWNRDGRIEAGVRANITPGCGCGLFAPLWTARWEETRAPVAGAAGAPALAPWDDGLILLWPEGAAAGGDAAAGSDRALRAAVRAPDSPPGTWRAVAAPGELRCQAAGAAATEYEGRLFVAYLEPAAGDGAGRIGYVTADREGKWSAPRPAPGELFSDAAPAVAVDAGRLVLVYKLPGPAGALKRVTMRRGEDGAQRWSEPESLGRDAVSGPCLVAGEMTAGLYLLYADPDGSLREVRGLRAIGQVGLDRVLELPVELPSGARAPARDRPAGAWDPLRRQLHVWARLPDGRCMHNFRSFSVARWAVRSWAEVTDGAMAPTTPWPPALTWGPGATIEGVLIAPGSEGQLLHAPAADGACGQYIDIETGAVVDARLRDYNDWGLLLPNLGPSLGGPHRFGTPPGGTGARKGPGPAGTPATAETEGQDRAAAPPH